VDNLFAPDRTEFVAHVNQALRAHLIFKDEVDYIVRDGEVIIVDEHTGRMMEGRRYSDGLHQALEAKERVPVKKETQTLASITFQNFFRMYKKLAGMTGTADTEANEFKKIYNLEVVVVPTNVTVQRIDAPDRVYRTEAEKWNAIVEEIRDCYERGQPTLVGTVSVEKSEGLAGLLRKAGIPHSVLNAKQHEREAEVIMNAGKPHAVTVATNMAGRGTDIVLGGYPLYTKDLEKLEGAEGPIGEFRDFMLKKQFDQAAAVIGRISGQADQQLARDIHERALIWLGEHKKVKELGGLHILGTERHEARRIDNQLRGRSGRQGDPGSSRFYLSLEDHLMRIFGGERIKRIMTWVGMEEGQELEAGMVDRAIARAQKRVEGHNFDIRKHLLEYDEVMNRQREFVYAERNKLLDNDNVRDDLLSWAEEVVEAKIVEFCESNDVQRWEAEGLAEWLRNGLGVEIAIDPEAFAESRNPQLDLFNHIWTEAKRLYLEKVARVGEENFSYVERRIALDVIDARWKEHLYALDHLREGVWASGYAERNPLVEFKLEGFRMFDAMVESIKAQLAEFLFRVQIEGPVVPQTAAPRRTEGIASHQSLESFGDGGGPARAAPASGAIREAETTTSSGGASRRRSSRRRRR
jgi:preprotein translocase subunit SecA